MASEDRGAHELDDDDDDDDDDDHNIDNTYLTFEVDRERFAIHVTYVTEIVRLQKIFTLPDVPSHIRGVINLRGKVIELLDVRARFGSESIPYGERTVVVVIEVGDTPIGLVVDRVFDIAEFLPSQIEPASQSHRKARARLVTGIGKRAEQLIFILDVPTLIEAPSSPTPASTDPVNATRERTAP